MSNEAIMWTLIGVYVVGAVVAGAVYDMDDRSPTDPDHTILVWLFWPIIALVIAFGTIVFLATSLVMKVARHAPSRTASDRGPKRPSGGWNT